MLFTQKDVVKTFNSNSSVGEEEDYKFVFIGEFPESLEFSFTGDLETKVIFVIRYWKDDQGGIWFNFTDLYNGLAKWLSNNHPDMDSRYFWRMPNRWLSLSSVRKQIFNILSEGFYPDTATKVFSYSLISYQFLAENYPDHCKVKGKVRSAVFFTDKSFTLILIGWLEEKTGFALYDWFNKMIASIT